MRGRNTSLKARAFIYHPGFWAVLSHCLLSYAILRYCSFLFVFLFFYFFNCIPCLLFWVAYTMSFFLFHFPHVTCYNSFLFFSLIFYLAYLLAHSISYIRVSFFLTCTCVSGPFASLFELHRLVTMSDFIYLYFLSFLLSFVFLVSISHYGNSEAKLVCIDIVSGVVFKFLLYPYFYFCVLFAALAWLTMKLFVFEGKKENEKKELVR